MEAPLDSLFRALHQVVSKIAETVAEIKELIKNLYVLLTRQIEDIIKGLHEVTESLFEIQIITHISKMSAYKDRLSREEDVLNEIESEGHQELELIMNKFHSKAEKLLETRNENIYKLCKHIFDLMDEEASFVENKMANEIILSYAFEDSINDYSLDFEREAINDLMKKIKETMENISSFHEEIQSILKHYSKDDLKEVLDKPTIIILPMVQLHNLQDGKINSYILQLTPSHDIILREIPAKLEDIITPGMLPQVSETHKIAFSRIESYLKELAPELKEEELKIIKNTYDPNPWFMSREGEIK